MVRHDAGETFGARPRSLEKIEHGFRLPIRADRLAYAVDAVYEAPNLDDVSRWRILGVLQDAHEEASAELARYRDNPPPPA